MEYIDFEAEVSNEDQVLSFSSDEIDEDSRSFVDDGDVENQGLSFSRKLINQTRDPTETMFDGDKSNLDTRDLQPELFIIEDRGDVEFDAFDDSNKCAEKIKKSLLSFDREDIKDSFFYAVLYGLMFKLMEKKVRLEEEIKNVLGEEFYRDISKCKELLQLDDSSNKFFKKCALANGFLKKRNLFLRVYERRDKFRGKLKQRVTGKK